MPHKKSPTNSFNKNIIGIRNTKPLYLFFDLQEIKNDSIYDVNKTRMIPPNINTVLEIYVYAWTTVTNTYCYIDNISISQA